MSTSLRQANWNTWGKNISELAKKFDKDVVTSDLDSLTPEKFGIKYNLDNPKTNDFLEPRKNNRNVFDRNYVIAECVENGKFSVTFRDMRSDTQFIKSKDDMVIKYRLTGKDYRIVEMTDNRELAIIIKEDRRNILIKNKLVEEIGVLPD
jgi:hypothetical protein